MADNTQGRPEDLKRVEDACRALREHFDTVEILVTRFDEEKKYTRHCNSGLGNHYARYGHICDWKIRFEEQIKIQENSDEDRIQPEGE